MKPLGVLVLTLCAVAVAFPAAAQTPAQQIDELNRRLDAVTARVHKALSDEAEARAVIVALDGMEEDFARIAGYPGVRREPVRSEYDRLQDLLLRIYNSYKHQADQCSKKMDGNGKCHELRRIHCLAAHPLGWLWYTAATTVAMNDGNDAQQLLKQASAAFSETFLIASNRNEMRDSLFGHAVCAKELGRFDSAAYMSAISDFRALLDDGSKTPQHLNATLVFCGMLLQPRFTNLYAILGEQYGCPPLRERH